MVAATLALAAVLLAGCGGSADDQAKVEAGMRHYLVSLAPQDAPFPVGAGTPRVKNNGCFKLGKDSLGPNLRPLPPRLALWNCVIKFGTLATPVIVTVRDSTEVVFAMPGGVLKEVEPNASQPPK